MIFYYPDSSAWVKRYVEELGTPLVQLLFAENSFFACAPLGLIEVMATLARKGKALGSSQLTIEQQSQALHEDWQFFVKVQFTGDVINRASDIAKSLALRGADAIHLASALELQQRFTDPADQLIFVTSDTELLRAAQVSGLTVVDPMQSPAP